MDGLYEDAGTNVSSFRRRTNFAIICTRKLNLSCQLKHIAK